MEKVDGRVETALGRHEDALLRFYGFSEEQKWARNYSPSVSKRHKDDHSRAARALAVVEAASFLDQLEETAIKVKEASEKAAKAESKTRLDEAEHVKKQFEQSRGAAVIDWDGDAYIKGTKDMNQIREALTELDALGIARNIRHRQRVGGRVKHALLEAATGLLVGVFLIEVVSNQLQALNIWLAWAFAIVSWVVLDYFLEPKLQALREKEMTELVNNELSTARSALAGMFSNCPNGRKDPIWSKGWI